ncbi:2-keto-4-pentenoate hydratase [Amycolatopsis sp. 195334CR]|uniref:2-keto-4-pentenoate hydratase n=1 Tax=Amycolatopsis sp. 195334CR TaxID=2814588 RepID=UPI001A8C08D1|nr:fumarylacetoacetate hydrolase family protein [Amycolatopsis sp. 195334CR]MBN6039301.1 fumarylacetoacetate hydrolase family protein [Amycolatopsis sp. 195334CR]
MPDTALHHALAEDLLAAYVSGEPIPPLIEAHPGLTVTDAYAVQLEQVRHWEAGGGVVRGHKVGLSSEAARRQIGVDEPDFGHLLDTMFYAEGEPIPTARFLQPRIEPEIAFVLRKPLRGPGVTADQAADAVDHLLPALELVDSRIRDWRISIVDTVADNASSGAVVLGATPVPLDAIDLSGAPCALRLNDEVIETGDSSAVMGSPLNSLVWIANKLGEMGTALQPGHVILSGSITRVAPVAPGDRVTCTIDGLGAVSALFS